MKVIMSSLALYKKLQIILDLEEEPIEVSINSNGICFTGPDENKEFWIGGAGKNSGKEKFIWTTWDKVSDALKRLPEQPITLEIVSPRIIDINCVLRIK
jgi:hypothetical protein